MLVFVCVWLAGVKATALLSQISDFSYQPPQVNNTIEVICEDAGAMDSEDSPSLGQLDLPSTSAGSSSVGGMKAKGKRSCSNTGPEQPIKKKKLAEKQLEFMKGLLDEQRALRLSWESSRSAELSLRERELSLLQHMHDDFILMQQKPKEK
ncbi:hypothetical protein HPB47_004909 [Ixodes persulcatus]|uniref:Uncharacterized protein n=1 Tax=Ixodes persulcatus TaxID=34615 RepID=A0AC60PEH0_IXOPE|nr:hypothetical protein HPB47_004909 [Ixodes persulcatus]